VQSKDRTWRSNDIRRKKQLTERKELEVKKYADAAAAVNAMQTRAPQNMNLPVPAHSCRVRTPMPFDGQHLLGSQHHRQHDFASSDGEFGDDIGSSLLFAAD
jgi:hypothetical protein